MNQRPAWFRLLPASAVTNFRQQTVCFHKIPVTTVFVLPDLHPAIAVCVFALLLLLGELIYNRLVWARTDQIVGIGAGYREKSTHFLMRESRLLSDLTQSHPLAAKFQYSFLMFLRAIFSRQSKDLLL